MAKRPTSIEKLVQYMDACARARFVLEHIDQLTEPVLCRGSLGLWTVPPAIVEGVIARGFQTRSADERRATLAMRRNEGGAE